MNYLVGRSKDSEKDDIRTTLEKYTILFPENRTMEDLLKEQREIAALREQLNRLTQSP
jgi:hypothetical protein